MHKCASASRQDRAAEELTDAGALLFLLDQLDQEKLGRGYSRQLTMVFPHAHQ